ncbi:MAG: MFS transporter [Candidatus Sumerlaeota bacterium]
MKNRWIVLAAGILIQTILGGIYAWSIFVPYLIDDYALSKGQCGTIFGLCIATFTLSMIAGGRLLSAKGPRLTALVGAVLFLSGYLVASASGGSFLLLLLGISILSGAGIGFGYVCPLTVGLQWFPNSKGLITGVSVAGFGGGAIVLSSLATHFLDAGMDVLILFRWLAAIAGGLLILASLLLAVPWEIKKTATTNPILSEILTLPFLLCLFGIFMGTFSGLLVVGNLSPIALNAGLSVELAATSVSIFAVGNALGRIAWGFLFDRIRYISIPASLACFALVLMVLAVSSNTMILLFCAGLLGFGFGANFVIYASALSNHFDIASFPRLYPVCFLGYGLAGVTGPGIGGFLADLTGNYQTALYLSAAMVAFAALVTAAGLRVFQTQPIPEQEPLVEPAS